MVNELTRYIVFGIFGGVWIVLMLLGWFILYHRDHATFRRRWFPRLMVIGGVVCWAFAAALCALSQELTSLAFLALFVGMMLLISYFHMRQFTFCDKCGVALYILPWSKPMRFCPHCGTELGGKPSRQADPDFDG